MRRVAMSVGVLAVASSPLFAQCPDSERAALEQFDRTWGAATTRGDRAALVAIYADDYAGISPIGTQGKTQSVDDAVRAAERARANPDNVPKLSYDNYVIACTPVSATVTHRNVITTTANGREQTTYSRSVHVLEKRGGKWQVVSNAGGPLNDAQQLAYMESDWNRAIKTHDLAWYERNYADDVTDVSTTTGAIATTKADALASIRTDKRMIDSLALSELTVRVDGTVGVVTGINHLRGKDDQGKPLDRRVRFTDVFIKRDGRWQVWATQGTVIP